jgi:hypothetical protein
VRDAWHGSNRSLCTSVTVANARKTNGGPIIAAVMFLVILAGLIVSGSLYL